MRIIFIFASLILVLTAFCGLSRAQTTLVKETVKREGQVKTLEVKLGIKQTMESQALAAATNKKDEGQKLALNSTGNRFLIDGEMIRYESVHPLLSTNTGGTVQDRTVSASNTQQVKSYFQDRDKADRDHQGGVIQSPERLPVGRLPYLFPLLFTYRGCTPSLLGFSFSEFDSIDTSTKSPKQKLDHYSMNIQDLQHHVWVMPDNDSLVKKFQILRGSVVLQQIDIAEFKMGANNKPYPAVWFYTNYDAKGKLKSTFQVEVEQIVLNSKVDAKEFDPDFPPGFDIQDLINKKNYLVLDSGAFFETESLRDKSVTGEVAQKSITNQWILYVSITIVVSVILFLGLLILRRKRIAR